jgi:hypothetical protein
LRLALRPDDLTRTGIRVWRDGDHVPAQLDDRGRVGLGPCSRPSRRGPSQLHLFEQRAAQSQTVTIRAARRRYSRSQIRRSRPPPPGIIILLYCNDYLLLYQKFSPRCVYRGELQVDCVNRRRPAGASSAVLSHGQPDSVSSREPS